MRLELWADVDHARPDGLSCREGHVDVGNAGPARAGKKGGNIQISSIKRFLRLVWGIGGWEQEAAGRLLVHG